MGNKALNEGRYEEAITFYNETLAFDPTNKDALNNRGVAKIESDHPYEAILDYNSALVQDPGFEDALFNRAFAYEKIGKLKKALVDTDKLLAAKKDSAFIHFYKGLVLTKLREYDSALVSFKIADSLAPQNAETLINIATVHYFREEMEKSKLVLKDVYQLEPSNPNASNLACLIALAEKQFAASLDYINQALEQVPGEPYFLNNRGFIYLQMDSLDRALVDINRSIVLNPENGWAYRNKGIYQLRKGEYSLAIDLFDRALETGEFIDEIYHFLGTTYYKSGQPKKACESWQIGKERGEMKAVEKHQLFCSES
ncbi:MAG: tetratricopeptide repeat protein [Bacteroidota bacterium]